MTTKLKNKIKAIENYLAPKLRYQFEYPNPKRKDYWQLRWIMEYLIFLKRQYYQRKTI